MGGTTLNMGVGCSVSSLGSSRTYQFNALTNSSSAEKNHDANSPYFGSTHSANRSRLRKQSSISTQDRCRSKRTSTDICDEGRKKSRPRSNSPEVTEMSIPTFISTNVSESTSSSKNKISLIDVSYENKTDQSSTFPTQLKINDLNTSVEKVNITPKFIVPKIPEDKRMAPVPPIAAVRISGSISTSLEVTTNTDDGSITQENVLPNHYVRTVLMMFFVISLKVFLYLIMQ